MSAGSRAREEVAAVLRSAGGPRSAAEIAEDLGIHSTTARFHLRNLVEAGRARTVTLRSTTVGRPRTGYLPIVEVDVSPLLTALLDQLGDTPEQRETAAAAAGRAWAGTVAPPPTEEIAVPDPVTVTAQALGALGFQVSACLSAFGVHEITLCSCPLRSLSDRHPEIARGVARGAIEAALDAAAGTLGSHYRVTVNPDATGSCEITLRLARQSDSTSPTKAHP